MDPQKPLCDLCLVTTCSCRRMIWAILSYNVIGVAQASGPWYTPGTNAKVCYQVHLKKTQIIQLQNFKKFCFKFFRVNSKNIYFLDCDFACHTRCLSQVTRACVHVAVSERPGFELRICPEVGLASDQKFKCAECSSSIIFSKLYPNPTVDLIFVSTIFNWAPFQMTFFCLFFKILFFL